MTWLLAVCNLQKEIEQKLIHPDCITVQIAAHLSYFRRQERKITIIGTVARPQKVFRNKTNLKKVIASDVRAIQAPADKWGRHLEICRYYFKNIFFPDFLLAPRILLLFKFFQLLICRPVRNCRHPKKMTIVTWISLLTYFVI